MIQIGSHEAAPLMPSLAQPTVCVVDDDAGVLGSLRFLLETDGFAVRTFRSGAAALTAARANDIDCFVVDYKMPDMNGIELVSKLRNRGVLTPVILITGYPDDNIPVRAAAAGVRHVLRKPLLDESLARQIRGAIEDAQCAGPGNLRDST
jgi:FixJ family two-component response regulator